VAEWWSEADNKGRHPFPPRFRSLPTVRSPLTLPAHPTVLAAAEDSGSALPFALSDIGWVLVAVALLLVAAVLLDALGRRRRRRAAALKPAPHRSTEP
jgi:hypothetical protein